MLIQTKGKLFTIPSEWVPRWSFLRDYTELAHSSHVTWDYTSDESLEAWMVLNTSIDRVTALHPSVDANLTIKDKYSTITSATPSYPTVRMMNPGPCEALLYLHADSTMSQEHYIELLTNTGRYIREERVSLPYTTVGRYEKVFANKTFAGILGVDTDPAFVAQHNTTDEMYEMYRETTLSLPYDLITGIVHRAFQLHVRSESHRDIADIPWYHIDWKLVGSHVLTQENIVKYNKAIEALRHIPITSVRFSLAVVARGTPFNLARPPNIVSLLAGKMSPSQALDDGYYGRLVIQCVDGSNRFATMYKTELFELLVYNTARTAADDYLLFYCKEVLGLGRLLGMEKWESEEFPSRSVLIIPSAAYLASLVRYILDGVGRGGYAGITSALAEGMGSTYMSTCVATLARLAMSNLKNQLSNAATGEMYVISSVVKMRKRVRSLFRHMRIASIK